jgi:predicted HAD superfamily hydrolase
MDRFTKQDDLRKIWMDQYVKVNEDKQELKRFAGIIGRVVTVNYNGKAIVDFQDGGWYDIPASEDYLTKLDPAEAQAKYKNVNSAQVIPEKQG